MSVTRRAIMASGSSLLTTASLGPAADAADGAFADVPREIAGLRLLTGEMNLDDKGMRAARRILTETEAMAIRG
jgi:hypothetical protein